jgi:hypothetical protein
VWKVEIPLPFRVEFSVEKVWKFRFSFVDLTRDLRVNLEMPINEHPGYIFAAVRDGQLTSKNEEELRSMLITLRRYHETNAGYATLPTIEAIENELYRRQNDRLSELVTNLKLIAEDQKQLAIEAGRQTTELTNQTNRLVCETVTLRRFTKGLVILTIVLAVSAVVQIVIMLFDYFSHTH